MTDLGSVAEAPVSSIIPRSARLLEIVSQYGPLEDKLPCGLADCRTAHGKGFLVEFEADGGELGIGRVGHICGRNNFGASWTEAKDEFDRKVHAAQVEQRRQLFLSRMGEVLPGLDRLSPLVGEIDRVRRTLDPVISVSAAAAKGNGIIEVFRGGQVVHRHRLVSIPFWLTGGELGSRLATLRDDCTRFLEYLASGNVDLREVERRVTGFSDVPHRWKIIRNGIESALAATSPRHLAGLLETANMIALQAPELWWETPKPNSGWRLNIRLTGAVLETRTFRPSRPDGEPDEVWSSSVDLAAFGTRLQEGLEATAPT